MLSASGKKCYKNIATNVINNNNNNNSKDNIKKRNDE